VHITMSADVHFGVARPHLTEIGIARARDPDFHIVGLALGVHGARAMDAHRGAASFELGKIDMAGPGDVDIDGVDLAIRPDVAGTGDLHLALAHYELVQISIAGAGDFRIKIVDPAIGFDIARARHLDLEAGLIQLIQNQVAAAGGLEFAEFPPRQGDGQIPGAIAPAPAIHFDLAVMNPQMRQNLGIAADMQLVAAARRVTGLAQHGQGDMVTIPIDVAAAGGGIGKRLAAFPPVKPSIKSTLEVASANSGGGAHAGGGGGQTDDGVD